MNPHREIRIVLGPMGSILKSYTFETCDPDDLERLANLLDAERWAEASALIERLERVAPNCPYLGGLRITLRLECE